tara:strand:+ start:443 stop:664 length:222 start_codon:yes stop_codon:yes gene_type:complete
MRKDKKFAVINSYKKLCVPVEFLPKLLDNCFMVETEYTGEGGDTIKNVEPIDKCEFFTGEEIDMAEAFEKIST